MYNDLVKAVQIKLDSTFLLPCNLIGEFFDIPKGVLIQNYECAHVRGSTMLVIVQISEFGASINFVHDSITLK